jgi:hypothetical protein
MATPDGAALLFDIPIEFGTSLPSGGWRIVSGTPDGPYGEDDFNQAPLSFVLTSGDATATL